MAKWTAFPHLGEYTFDAANVKKHWARLHAGDAEPVPKDKAVLEAWAIRLEKDQPLRIDVSVPATAAAPADLIGIGRTLTELARIDRLWQGGDRHAALLGNATHALSLLTLQQLSTRAGGEVIANLD